MFTYEGLTNPRKQAYWILHPVIKQHQNKDQKDIFNYKANVLK